ncbi:MAG: hypothetical protein HY691_07610 [Chloroflexi bacterium]|nr:hypothetical protein [Chloroflexota bacterium]
MADDASPPRYRRRPGDVVVRPMRRRTERIVTVPRRLPRRPPPPALVLAGSFSAATLVGTLVLMLQAASVAGDWTSPRVALFTAVSAVSLTGLVLVDTGTYWSGFGQAAILVLIQLGGLGFMTGASLIFILLGRHMSLEERLLMREAVGAFGIGQAAQLAKRIALVMFALEAAGAVVLFGRFAGEHAPMQALWLAVFYAISAFNNAGFDLVGSFRSVSVYQSDSLVLLTMVILFVLGALSYLTLHDIATRRSFRRLSLDSKLILTSAALLWSVGFAAILGAE